MIMNRERSMTLEELAVQLNAARYIRNDDSEALEILKAFIASRPTAPLHNTMTNAGFYAEIDALCVTASAQA